MDINRLVLDKDFYYTQLDNKVSPKYSCFPTSMAMGMAYCLQELGLDKTSVGCPEDKQLEDYINEISASPPTMKWIKKNVDVYGKWMIQVTPRENFYVEEYIFNLLMNPLGYKCTFTAMGTFEKYCEIMGRTQLPIILRGKFKPETPVSGHLVCGIGYDKDKHTFIINDPYGNALKNYKASSKGTHVEYPCNHWFLNEDQKIYFVYLEKIS